MFRGGRPDAGLVIPPQQTRQNAFLGPTLDHQLLDFRYGLGGIESLGAGLRAVHNGMAAIEAERVFEIVEPVTSRLVSAVDDPAIGLQQRGGAGGTGAISTKTPGWRRAARGHDALLKPLEVFPVHRGLVPV